ALVHHWITYNRPLARLDVVVLLREKGAILDTDYGALVLRESAYTGNLVRPVLNREGNCHLQDTSVATRRVLGQFVRATTAHGVKHLEDIVQARGVVVIICATEPHLSNGPEVCCPLGVVHLEVVVGNRRG